MTIGEKIRTVRKSKNLTQKQLGDKCGMADSAIRKYESGRITPKHETLQRIASALDVHFLDLIGVGPALDKYDIQVATPSNSAPPNVYDIFDSLTDEEKVNFWKLANGLEPGRAATKKAPSDLPEEALKIAKDYNALDRHGKNMTKIVITEEQKRMEEERRRQEAGEEAGDEPQGTRIIPLYYTPAAAGMASPAAGQDFDYIEISRDAPRNADFAVKIDGDSMEPYIMDGSIVYVNREPLENGDVGIFYVDGDMICKQYYKDEQGNVRLLSLNRACSHADRFIHYRDNDTVLTYYGRVILPRRPMVSWA